MLIYLTFNNWESCDISHFIYQYVYFYIESVLFSPVFMLHCDIYRNGNLPEYFENSFCDVIACFVADVLFDFLLI